MNIAVDTEAMYAAAMYKAASQSNKAFREMHRAWGAKPDPVKQQESERLQAEVLALMPGSMADLMDGIKASRHLIEKAVWALRDEGKIQRIGRHRQKTNKSWIWGRVSE